MISLRKLFQQKFEGHRGRPGKVGGSLPRGSSPIAEEEEYTLSRKDRDLIERASTENSNSFTAKEKKRLSGIIQAQPPLRRDKVVYRGIDVDADGRNPGEKWIEQRFVSTSTSRSVAGNYSQYDNFVVAITIPKGTKVLDYSSFGYWGQDEILLDTGTKFTSVTNKKWKVR